MTSSIPSRLESSLRLACGFLLWTVSATLTVVLLLSLGSGSIPEKVLLGAVAVALEGAKILTWRAGRERRIYTFFLIALSGTASIGAALQVVEKSKGNFLALSLDDLRSSPSYMAKADEVKSIDLEVGTLIDRMGSLPPDFTTASGKIESALSALRDRKTSLLSSMGTDEKMVGASYTDGNMVVLMAKAIGIRPEVLLLVLLLFVSASIETGALILTMPDKGRPQSQKQSVETLPTPEAVDFTSAKMGIDSYPSPISPMTAEKFLEVAKEGSDLPYLHGRDKTAERLGISYIEAKKIVSSLIADGKVVVDGKRLRLAMGKAVPTASKA